MAILRSVELFTGAGGLALGISRAGFTHDLLVEVDKHALATLGQNREHVPEIQGWPAVVPDDVSEVEYASLEGKVDLLAAGTPCQPFSLGGKHQGDLDDRNMFPEVFRATRELRPRAILVENVRGLMRNAVKPYFDYILRQLERPEREPIEGEDWRAHDAKLAEAIEAGFGGSDELSYDVDYDVLNAADFGVPQRRQRIFIVAFRRDLSITPTPYVPTHSRDALLHAQYVDGTYWQQHGLSPQRTPEVLIKRVDRIARSDPPSESRWRTVRDSLAGLPEPLDLQEHSTFHNHAGNPGARAYVGHTGSPLDEPAKTLKAGVHGVPGGENMLRRCDGTVRYFTPREAARLQTFPDEYRFSGPWSEVMRQLGNAVPVEMAKHLSDSIRETLKRASTGERSSHNGIDHRTLQCVKDDFLAEDCLSGQRAGSMADAQRCQPANACVNPHDHNVTIRGSQT